MRRGIASTVVALALTACGAEPGADGSDLPVAFELLAGGIVFATHTISGSAGYDLYWIPYPDTRSNVPVPFVRLTSTNANETQPSVARGGKGIAFAGGDGIYLITASGRIKQISDTSDTPFHDSLPALSFDAARVAWVREDTSRKIGASDFSETYIMMANADGTMERKLQPIAGVVQDAPAFDPAPNSVRVAWTEFNANTLVPGFGPRDYGIRIFDFVNNTGTTPCQVDNGTTRGTEVLPPRETPYRCFGEHMTWPVPNTIVLGQDLLEINLDGRGMGSTWGEVVKAAQAQETGSPDIGTRGDGFFPRFPLSVSYDTGASNMVVDGVVFSVDGNLPTLAFFLSTADGGNAYRIPIQGLSPPPDIDTVNTVDYLFSLATPQIIPFQQ